MRRWKLPTWIKARHTLPMLAAALLLIAISMPLPARGAAQENSPQTITETTSCATCGMYPYRYPAWQAQLIFTDHQMAAFDGCKCLFRFLLNMENFDRNHTMKQIVAVWVKDYGSGEWIDGKTAYFVVGSQQLGPMGMELIPFASQAAAEAFKAKNGGSIEPYANISMDIVKPLMGGMHLQTGHGDQPHSMH